MSDKPAGDAGFDRQREQLVARLRAQRIASERVLAAIAATPRELFVPPELRPLAYDDNALPIAAGQTISQPTVVAVMTEALRVEPDSHVLEIGTGSGYQAAILAHLARSVVSVEVHPELAEGARRVLATLGIENVEVHVGDGSLGWPDAAPYDRILVTAAAPEIPAALLDQLRPQPGSRLVVPIGGRDFQSLVAVTWENGEWVERRGGSVRFVPLRGEAGWSDTAWSTRRHPFSRWRRKHDQ